MTDNRKLPFKFDGNATDGSGKKHSISIDVSSIHPSEQTPGCHCDVKCDFLSKRTIRIHGYCEGYTKDRAYNFLNRIFSFLRVSLEDTQGNTFRFDEIDMGKWYLPEKDDRPMEYWFFEHNMLDHLRLTRSHRLEAEFLEDTFENEHRPKMRELMFDRLHECYMVTQQYEKGRELDHQFADEFPGNPYAWKGLASTYRFAFFRPDQHPTIEDQKRSIEYYRKALEVAKEKDEWFRFISFDYCRALAEFSQWADLELAMIAILKDLQTSTREIDMHKLEGEWIEKIPDDEVSPAVIKDYQDALEWDRERLWKKGHKA